ncbi:MAG TPA: NfeD family protein [Longimicrobiales bacterium]|nr:NfeD family protein [Longimicrobiales bacterium]
MAKFAGITLAVLGIGLSASAPVQAQVVYRIPVRGTIELGLAPFVQRGIREAEKAGAAAVVLELETPGGRIDAAQHIVRALQDTKLPTYAFVNQHAYSAGAFIALATDGVFMRNGSVMGAATPVDGGGNKAPEKIVSAMRSEMRALAQARGLDPRVAEGMVDETLDIPGVKPAGKLLTLTSGEAIRLNYARAADDWPQVLRAIGQSGARTLTVQVNWAEQVVRFLTNPMVAPLLLSLGFLGLIFELKLPGFGLAGAAGLTSLGLFFGSHYLVGLAGLEEILLLLLGVGLVIVEAFVVPGFGVFGIGGALAIMASVYLSLVSSLSTASDFTTAAGILATVVLVILVAAWAIVRSLPRSGRLSRSGILLGDATSANAGYISAAIRPELVGTTGVALTDLRPSGTARFGEERLDVVAESEFISAGTAIKVVRSEGYRHVVQPVA